MDLVPAQLVEAPAHRPVVTRLRRVSGPWYRAHCPDCDWARTVGDRGAAAALAGAHEGKNRTEIPGQIGLAW